MCAKVEVRLIIHLCFLACFVGLPLWQDHSVLPASLLVLQPVPAVSGLCSQAESTSAAAALLHLNCPPPGDLPDAAVGPTPAAQGPGQQVSGWCDVFTFNSLSFIRFNVHLMNSRCTHEGNKCHVADCWIYCFVLCTRLAGSHPSSSHFQWDWNFFCKHSWLITIFFFLEQICFFGERAICETNCRCFSQWTRTGGDMECTDGSYELLLKSAKKL